MCWDLVICKGEECGKQRMMREGALWVLSTVDSPLLQSPEVLRTLLSDTLPDALIANETRLLTILMRILRAGSGLGGLQQKNTHADYDATKYEEDHGLLLRQGQ